MAYTGLGLTQKPTLKGIGEASLALAGGIGGLALGGAGLVAGSLANAFGATPYIAGLGILGASAKKGFNFSFEKEDTARSLGLDENSSPSEVEAGEVSILNKIAAESSSLLETVKDNQISPSQEREFQMDRDKNHQELISAFSNISLVSISDDENKDPWWKKIFNLLSGWKLLVAPFVKGMATFLARMLLVFTSPALLGIAGALLIMTKWKTIKKTIKGAIYKIKVWTNKVLSLIPGAPLLEIGENPNATPMDAGEFVNTTTGGDEGFKVVENPNATPMDAGEFVTTTGVGEFKDGGSFIVDGDDGGVDKLMVVFNATKGEKVTVETPKQQKENMKSPTMLGDKYVDMDTIEGRREFYFNATEEEWTQMYVNMENQGMGLASSAAQMQDTSKLEVLDYMFGISVEGQQSVQTSMVNDDIKESFGDWTKIVNSIGDVTQMQSGELMDTRTGSEESVTGENMKTISWDDWKGDEDKLRSLGVYNNEDINRYKQITGSSFMDTSGGRGRMVEGRYDRINHLKQIQRTIETPKVESFKLKPKVEEITNYIDNSSSKNQKSTKTYEFGGGFSVTDGHTLSPLTNR